MMRNFKSAAAIFLAVVCAAGCLSGCEGKKNGNEKMEITWMGPPYYPSSTEGNYSEKLLEEKFNVEIKPVYLDEEAYKTKKPLMMSSGEIPDIVYEMDPADVQGDVRQGFLCELPFETLKKYAPKLVAEITDNEPAVWLYSNCNGKNYGLPNLFYSGDLPIVGVWRKDWLENVGITKTPETIDEMHEAFLRFVNDDPDGNGKNDTYGMSGDMSAHYTTFSEIFGAYGSLPFNWIEKDGKPEYGGLQSETADALKTLAQWYGEGLIDPDFITDSVVKNLDPKFKNGQNGYFNNMGQFAGSFDKSNSDSFIGIMKQINPKAEIVRATLPKGPDGKSGTFVWSKGGHIISLGKQVKNDEAKMKKIFEMLEYMFTNQDFLAKLQAGEEGVHYNIEDDKGVVYIPPYNDSKERAKELSSTGIAGSAFFGIVPAIPETYNRFYSENTKKSNEELSKLNVMKDVFLKPDVVQGSDKYFNDIKNKQTVLMSEIIRGEKSADSYVDEMASIWKNNGGEELDKSALEMIERKNEILKEIGN